MKNLIFTLVAAAFAVTPLFAQSPNQSLTQTADAPQTRSASQSQSVTQVQSSAQDKSQMVMQASGYGELVVECNPPEAKIYIDGEYIGEAPIYIPSQKTGEYTLSAEKEGFVPQQKKVIVTEKRTTVNLHLQDPLKVCDVKPTFKGGDTGKFSKWVTSKLSYSEYTNTSGVPGRVVMRFTIDVDGTLKNIKVISSNDPYLEEEAVRVVSMSPKWKPAMLNGTPVAVIYTFPVFSGKRR